MFFLGVLPYNLFYKEMECKISGKQSYVSDWSFSAVLMESFIGLYLQMGCYALLAAGEWTVDEIRHDMNEG